jgi:peptidyl-prolyl cis-trans isomerase D
VSKNSLFDKAVADAAFSLPEDGVSEPIKNAFGATIVHVVKIDPVSIRPLADVEPALRAEIASAHAASRIQSLHDKVEDARASGQSLAEAAKAAELEVRTIGPVDATGKDKTGKPVADLPDATALLQAAFASDVGVDNDTVRTPDGGQIFYEVAAIEPARAQTFDEVKSRVEASWHREQVAKALSAKADALVKDVDGGQSLDAAAAALGLPVQHVADVRRSGGTGLNANTVAQVFSQPVGRAASAPGDDDTRIVLRILGSTVPPLDPDSPQIKQFDTQYQSWLGDDMLASYLTQVQSKIGVRINPEAYRAAIGSNS